MNSKMLPWLIPLGYPVLLWWHLSSLLERPYYQFVVFVPLLVYMLVRWPDKRIKFRYDYRWQRMISVGLATAFILLAAATWKWSPWTAMLSLLIVAFCLLSRWTGWSEKSRWISAWIMCWILLPLPFGWDERLTVALRGVTTQMTSRVLDQFGALHISYMNVIQVPAKSLFVADACSGVHSLYVLLAASLFWGLYLRRTILHTVLLVAFAFAVVLFENITRLVVIVLALGLRRDLSIGTNHMLLGLLLFVVSVGVIVSFDRLLLFFLRGEALDLGNSAVPSESNGSDASNTREIYGRGRMVMILIAPMFVACGATQWLLKPGQLPDLTSSFRSPPTLELLGEAALPESLAGYARLGYKQITRVVGDPFGQQSEQWLYGREPLMVQVSIDYPYNTYHDPRVCYSQVGWTIGSALVKERPLQQQQQIGDKPKWVDVAEGPVAVIEMSRPLEGAAILMFSLVDQDGRVSARLGDRSAVPRVEDVKRRFQSFFGSRTASSEGPPKAPLTQFQLLGRSAESMTSDQIEGLVAFYNEFRNHALDQIARGKHEAMSGIEINSRRMVVHASPSAVQE